MAFQLQTMQMFPFPFTEKSKLFNMLYKAQHGGGPDAPLISLFSSALPFTQLATQPP